MSENPAIAVLLRERESLNTQIKDLRDQVRAINDAIGKLGGVEAPQGRQSRAEGPTLNDLVLDLLDKSDKGETPQSIADRLTAGGRETRNTTVSSILTRLRRAGSAEKRDGEWFRSGKKKPPEGGGSPEEEAGAGVAAPAGSTPASSNPKASKLMGGTSLASSAPIQFPLAREKGG